MKHQVLLIFLMLIGFSPGWAQEVNSTAGSYHPVFKVAYTMGEAVVQSLQSSGIILTQGFQQPFDTPDDNPDGLAMGSASEGGTAPSTSAEVYVYPNPVNDRLFVEFPNDLGKMELLLRDPLGKIVLRESVSTENGRVALNMSNIPSQFYFLEIRSQKGELVKSFKILKGKN